MYCNHQESLYICMTFSGRPTSKPDILRLMSVLVIADVHANLAALDAVLAEAGAFDDCWCLGDTVGYGPDPGGCIKRLLEHAAVSVSGNHDLAAVGNISLNDFNPQAAVSALWTQVQLTEEQATYLRERPDSAVMGDCYLVHGSPRLPIWEYLFDVTVAKCSFDYFDTPYCLVGHTHRPAVFELARGHCVKLDFRDGELIELDDRRLILNPGSVGQPRDGDPRASYSIYDIEAATLSLHRVEYDIQLTQSRMRAAGLPEVLARRLSYGH